MSVDGHKLRKTFAKAMPLGVLVALLAGAVWMLWPTGERRRVLVSQADRRRPVMSDGLTLNPVDLPVALLFDCYENALENVPPRTDTSKRQWSWEAPPLPMEVARRELGKAGASENDRKVLAWLENWEEGWKKDYPTTTDQLWGLDALLKETKLRFEPLFEIGLGMSFLDGDEQASVWMSSGIKQADSGTATSRGAESSSVLRRLLAQSRSLWQRNDYKSLATRFSLECRIAESASTDWSKSKFLLAECLYHSHQVSDARAALEALPSLGESNRLSLTEVVELHWLRALIEQEQGDYKSAARDLDVVCAQPNFHHLDDAMRLRMVALARIGRVADARHACDEWARRFQPSFERVLAAEGELQRITSVSQIKPK